MIEANNMDTFEKQPAETNPIDLEWQGRLPPGKTLASVAASAKIVPAGTDATSTVLGTTSPPVTGTKAAVTVKAGTTGVDYQITLKSTFNDGSLLEDEWLMKVREL